MTLLLKKVKWCTYVKDSNMCCYFMIDKTCWFIITIIFLKKQQHSVKYHLVLYWYFNMLGYCTFLPATDPVQTSLLTCFIFNVNKYNCDISKILQFYHQWMPTFLLSAAMNSNADSFSCSMLIYSIVCSRMITLKVALLAKSCP